MENIRGGGVGTNDMKGHYFTKLVTEQRRLGGTSWSRRNNLVTRGAATEFFRDGRAREAGDKEWGDDSCFFLLYFCKFLGCHGDL